MPENDIRAYQAFEREDDMVVPDAPEPWPAVTRDPKDDYLVALVQTIEVDAPITPWTIHALSMSS